MLHELMNGDPSANARTSADLIPIGQRNQTLTQVGGKLRAQGLDESNIRAKLLQVNAAQTQEPLPHAEVAQIAASVARYAPGLPAARLPWFQFYPNDWFATNAVRLGEDYQRGWLIQLLAECWRHGGTLPADSNALWKLAGASSERSFTRKDRHLPVLSEFQLVRLEDGTLLLIHPWLALHHEEQSKKYRQRCEASAKGVAARVKGAEVPADEQPSSQIPFPELSDWDTERLTESELEPESNPETETEANQREK
jgi:primase-like protein